MSNAGKQATDKLVRNLRKQGFIVTSTKRQHWQVKHPDHEGVVHFGRQPNTENLRVQTKQLIEMGYKP
jgi:predicted RNA binding protein YcfA (HicA-like mRNA interferase family)